MEREDGKEGWGGREGKVVVVVVEEKKDWVGWQPDGDATVLGGPTFTCGVKLSRYRRATASLALGRKRLCPRTLLFPPLLPHGVLDGCSFCVLFQLSTQIKWSECTCG